MSDEEARRLLETRVAAGAKLVPVQRSDLRTIKLMRSRLHAAGVPTMLASGPPGG